MKPDRPPLIQFSGVRELFLHFERIFLEDGNSKEINALCGHYVRTYDHHFFHMVKLLRGHVKSGQRGSGQNRPTELARNVVFLEITEEFRARIA
jgi:hypothetical protein